MSLSNPSSEPRILCRRGGRLNVNDKGSGWLQGNCVCLILQDWYAHKLRDSDSIPKPETMFKSDTILALRTVYEDTNILFPYPHMFFLTHLEGEHCFQQLAASSAWSCVISHTYPHCSESGPWMGHKGKIRSMWHWKGSEIGYNVSLKSQVILNKVEYRTWK